MTLIKDRQGRGLEVTDRIDSRTVWKCLNTPGGNREAYLDRFEFGYNFGPPLFPPQVFVELTNYCNLRCTFCHWPDMKRPKQHMDPALMRKVVQECGGHWLYYLTFQFYGEPLLCVDLLAESVADAKSWNIPCVSTTSNMTLMTEEIFRRWMEAGLDTLNISFDGSSPEKYREIRGRDYHDVLARIKMVRRLRDEAGTGKPWLSLTMVRTDETDEEVEQFHAEMSRIVDALDVRSMMLCNYRGEANARYEDANPGWYVTRDQGRRIPCRQLGGKLIVTSGGEVTACCTDIDAELSLGNAAEKSLAEMWRSDQFGRLFMLHRQQRWDDLPEICQDCKDWDWGGAQAER